MEDKILIKRNPTLVISNKLFSDIMSRVLDSKVEVGGILIGYKLKSINEYRVVDVTYPFENDICQVCYFERVDEKHNEILQDKHLKDKSLTYLGDWHSHPKSSSLPSGLDFSTYVEHTKKSQTSAKHLFYLTIGNDINIQVYSFLSKKRVKEVIKGV